MVKVYVLFTLENDGACGDPECCGYPSIMGINIFRITKNKEEAKELVELSSESNITLWHDSLIKRRNEALAKLESKYGLDEIPDDLKMSEGDI